MQPLVFRFKNFVSTSAHFVIIKESGGRMKEQFYGRIKKYIFASVAILLILNLLIVVHMLGISNKYIGYNMEYSAVEFQKKYEEQHTFNSYYQSNDSIYNRLYISEWHEILASFYNVSYGSSEGMAVYYKYLDYLQQETSLTVELFDTASGEQLYPVAGTRGAIGYFDVTFNDLKQSLAVNDNLVHEETSQSAYKISLATQELNDATMVISNTSEGDRYSREFSVLNEKTRSDLKALMDENRSVESYYVINSDNLVLLGSDDELTGEMIELKDEAFNDLLAIKSKYVRRSIDHNFYINDSYYSDNTVYLTPLSDGNYLILLLNDALWRESKDSIKIVTMLLMVIGIVLLYFSGQVMMYLVNQHELTARRVAGSNQVNRMVVLIFTILVLLNGMATIQVSRIIIYHAYEASIIHNLERHAMEIENHEEDFKTLVSLMNNNSVVQTNLINEGLKRMTTVVDLNDDNWMIPDYDVETYSDLMNLQLEPSTVDAMIDENGYYIYFSGSKLFSEGKFDMLYESYVLEQLPGDNLHNVSRKMIYRNADENYLVYTKDIRTHVNLLIQLREEFIDACKIGEKEKFISNVIIYNDSGSIVLAHNGKDKFDSRKLKDELSNLPLWYWYQFRHHEMFRTISKTIEGNYLEEYSLVHYSEPLEYYFVYTIPSKMLFNKIERWYNIYVSAIMFLLLGVFLTLGIKVKLKKRG